MKDLSLPAEYEGAWCEVKSADNELLAVGKIKTVRPKYIIVSDKNIPMIRQGNLVKINIFSPGKEIRVCIGNVYLVTADEISFVNIISLVNNEKRNFFRLDTCIETTGLYRENERKLYPTETALTVLDMSLSGMKIRTDRDFSEGTVIGVKIRLKSKKEIMVNCEVVRIIGTTRDGLVKYGCRYITDEDMDLESICAFLFDKQREFINRQQTWRG